MSPAVRIAAAAARIPAATTLRRLQTVVRAPPQQQRLAGFSTSRATRNGNAPGNPELPAFNIRHIVSTPRGRRWLIAAFVVLAGIEASGWVVFAPKIWKEKGEEEGEN